MLLHVIKFLTDEQNLPFGQPKPAFKLVSFMAALLLVLLFLRKVLLSSSDWPEICYINHHGFKLQEIPLLFPEC